MKKTRCKPGDLALVIYDIPRCVKNVGRLVRVRGPLKANRVYQRHCWLIEPVTPQAWYIDCYWEVRRCTNLANLNLEHPDEWLMPLQSRGIHASAEFVVGVPVLEATIGHSQFSRPRTIERPTNGGGYDL